MSIGPKEINAMPNRTINLIPRGRPGFAATQREEILGMLRAAGPSGISRAVLIFEKHFTQCGARIHELQQMGYVIRSEQREGERYVVYVLVSEPLELKPLPEFLPERSSGDWYERQGKRRPTGLPLFDLGSTK